MAGNLTVNNLACATVNDKSMATHVLENGLGGSGQTWQNVTASRAFGTTYTNSTGKPIIATVFTSNGAASGVVRMFVDGQQVFRASTYTGEGASGISVIPNGSTYYATGTVALTSWLELR